VSKRTSLESLLREEPPAEVPAEPPPAPQPAIAPPPLPIRRRKKKSIYPTHTSVRLNKRVLKTIRTLADAHDVSMQTLLLEGVDLMLRRYGEKSIAEHGED
jgi:hypothetical protein